jgi:hypothetical protein
VRVLLTLALVVGAAVLVAAAYRILALARRYRTGEREKNFEVEARVLMAVAQKRGAPAKCPGCGKAVLSERAPRCLYCGSSLAGPGAAGQASPEAQ